MNDPHGITWHEGRYHAFYQHLPGRTTWAPECEWAHVSSSDLMGDWRDEGIALAPGDGDDGIWTGSLVVDDAGIGRAFYTSVVEPGTAIGKVRTATPDDEGWRSWRKGPVVVEAPPELDLIAFRDPFVRRDQGGWTMYAGAGAADGTAMALAWTSPDLERWTYRGPALQRSADERQPVWTGGLWECPQFIDVDGSAVMITSVWQDDVLYCAASAVGRFDGWKLTNPTWTQISYGDSYYAPSFFRDRDGRPCLSFWMRGVQDEDAGWAGCHSIPYVMSVRDGELRLRMHPTLEARLAACAADRTAGGLVTARTWKPVEGGQASLDDDGHRVASLTLENGTLVLRRPGTLDQHMPVTGGPVRILVDGPVLEVCGSGALCGGAIEPATSVTVTAGELS